MTSPDQLAPLIGVVLGAAAAMAATHLTDRLRWRREQAVRWDQRRLEAFTTFAATLKEILTLAFRLVASQKPGSGFAPIDRDTGLEVMANASARRSNDWESLLLLCDEETVAAGRRWRDAVRAVELLARRDTLDVDAWQRANEEVNQARDEFYVAARQSLGVRGGTVKQAPYLLPSRWGEPRDPDEIGV